MDLKSGHMFWPQVYDGPALNFEKLDRDLRCDIAIIGGGISGALAAYHLTRQGIDTVLVDCRAIGQGSTAASTGLLLYEIDTMLVELIDRLGQEKATAAYRASAEMLEKFEPIVADLGQRCGLVRRPSLYLASDQGHVAQLRDECEARQSVGIDVSFLSGAQLQRQSGIDRPGSLWSSQAFEIDPYSFTARLILRSVQRGLQVFDKTEIVRCDPHEHGMRLRAVDGPHIDAKKVVFASGYETMELLPRDLCKLTSTFAAVSQPIDDFSGWPQRCLIWETARPYLYVRTTQDNRVIIGGEDVDIIDPQQRDRLVRQKSQVLCDRFAELLPHMRLRPECAWAGVFGETKDGLPYIGSLPALPHAYFALGYGGNGITFSLLAAEIITALFLGKQDKRASLFGFDR
jgi:glycine/D-amino acid oxidase-like deaminating enzyme